MIKIDKHITLIDFPGFQFPYCNCLWIEDDINCLIESSPAPADLAYLQEQKVDLIVDSHAHHDHVSCNRYFPNSRILMHANDLALAQSGDNYLEVFGLKAFAQDDQFGKGYLERIGYHSTRVDGTIEEGQVINLGSTRFEVIHLPGHTPGHCGFLFPDQGFIFTADIDLAKFGPWYGNLNCSLADFFSSIERLLNFKAEYIITGHGEGIVREGITGRLKAYRDIIYARQKRIIDLLAGGSHTVEDIARQLPIYRRLPASRQTFWIFEQVMVLMHLRYLKELGCLIQDGDHFYLQGRQPL